MAELESRLSLSPFLSVSSSLSLSISYTLCCLSVIFFSLPVSLCFHIMDAECSHSADQLAKV